MHYSFWLVVGGRLTHYLVPIKPKLVQQADMRDMARMLQVTQGGLA